MYMHLKCERMTVANAMIYSIPSLSSLTLSLPNLLSWIKFPLKKKDLYAICHLVPQQASPVQWFSLKRLSLIILCIEGFTKRCDRKLTTVRGFTCQNCWSEWGMERCGKASITPSVRACSSSSLTLCGQKLKTLSKNTSRSRYRITRSSASWYHTHSIPRHWCHHSRIRSATQLQIMSTH